MERTKYRSDYGGATLADLDGVEQYMSKEELEEMRFKMTYLINSLLGIPDVQTRALMEQMFKRGYLAAHVILGDKQ